MPRFESGQGYHSNTDVDRARAITTLPPPPIIRQTVYGWERGEDFPTPEPLVALADLLDVTLDWDAR